VFFYLAQRRHGRRCRWHSLPSGIEYLRRRIECRHTEAQRVRPKGGQGDKGTRRRGDKGDKEDKEDKADKGDKGENDNYMKVSPIPNPQSPIPNHQSPITNR
jgi:hypothetical protein